MEEVEVVWRRWRWCGGGVEEVEVEVTTVYWCTPANLRRILFRETFSSTLGFSEATFSEGKLEKFQEIWADWRSLEAQGRGQAAGWNSI